MPENRPRVGCPVALLALLTVVLAPTTGRGQGPTDQELAAQHYYLGAKMYERADYEGALQQFSKSHALSGRPALLFNIARCHESLGQHERAIEHYEAYLKSGPKNAELVGRRIANLRRLVERRQAAAVTPTPATPDPGQEAATTPMAVPPVTDESAGAGGTPDRPRTKRLVGWSLVASGAMLIGTGIVLGVLAKGKQDELEQANRDGMEWSDAEGKESTGKALNGAAIATLATGSAAVAAGAVLLYLDHREVRTLEHAWLAPAVSHRGATISVGGRF